MPDLFDENFGIEWVFISTPFLRREIRFHFPKDDTPDTLDSVTRLGADVVNVKGVEYWLEGNVFNVVLTNFEQPFRVELSWRYNTDWK